MYSRLSSFSEDASYFFYTLENIKHLRCKHKVTSKVAQSFDVQSIKEEFTMITECKFQPLWFVQMSSTHVWTQLLISLWSITEAEAELVVHTWPLTCHWAANGGAACVLGALALWCDGSRQWALREPIPHGTPLPLDPLHYSYRPRWGGVGWQGRGNRIWKRKHQGSRPSQITRNFCLTSPEVANTGIEQFFERNWIWKQDWRSMGIPSRPGGDRIHCEAIVESMWFPWFTLPLWELILCIASDTVFWSAELPSC